MAEATSAKASVASSGSSARRAASAGSATVTTGIFFPTVVLLPAGVLSDTRTLPEARLQVGDHRLTSTGGGTTSIVLEGLRDTAGEEVESALISPRYWPHISPAARPSRCCCHRPIRRGELVTACQRELRGDVGTRMTELRKQAGGGGFDDALDDGWTVLGDVDRYGCVLGFASGLRHLVGHPAEPPAWW